MTTNNKYLRVMCDYGAHGLWHEVGAPLTVEEIMKLDLPFWLREMLFEWADVYETNQEWMPPEMNPKPFDYETFNKNGWAIARKIKMSKPDYTIFYFDELTSENVEVK